jgi:predicted nucleic acid-binding protein
MIMDFEDERVFLDTNILIRANVATAPLHKEARQALYNLANANAEMWLSRQVLREYLVNVTRPQTYANPAPLPLVIKQVQYFLSNLNIAEDNAEVTTQLLKLVESLSISGKQMHDANIVATMQIYEIKTLLTHNVKDFQRFTKQIRILPLEADS